MTRYEWDRYAEAAEYDVTVALAPEDELTSKDQIEMLADQGE